MTAQQFVAATCVEYVATVVKGSGWLGMPVSLDGWEVRIDTRQTYAYLVARDVAYRIPTMGLNSDGTLAVRSYAWACTGQDTEQIRVLADHGDTVDVVSLYSGAIRTLTRDRISKSMPL